MRWYREELKKTYSSQAEGKQEAEYKRTKQDFYRMELDRMEDYHPSSRPMMRKTYFAYLQNNPGSKRAVKVRTWSTASSVQASQTGYQLRLLNDFKQTWVVINVQFLLCCMYKECVGEIDEKEKAKEKDKKKQEQEREREREREQEQEQEREREQHKDDDRRSNSSRHSVASHH